MSTSRTIARSVSAVSLHQLAQVTGALLFVLFIPRALGVDVYGQFAFIFALANVFQMLGEMGYQEVFGRYVPEARHHHGEAGIRGLVRALFPLKMLIGVVLAGVAALTAWWLVPQWLTADHLLWLAVAVLARVWATGPFHLLLGLGQTAQWAVENTWRQVLMAGLMALIFVERSLLAAMLALAVHELVFLALGVWWTRRWFTLETWRAPLLLPLKEIAQLALVFAVANFAVVLMFRISALVVEAATQSAAEVGFFDLAQGALLLVYLFLFQVAYAFMPILTQLRLEHKPAEATLWLGRFVRYTGVFVVLACGGMWAVSTPAAPILFGVGFERAGETMRAIALGLLALPVLWGSTILCTVDKRPLGRAWSALAGLLIFGVGAWLGREAGAVGIALAFGTALLGAALGFGRDAWHTLQAGGRGGLLALLGVGVFAPLVLVSWPTMTAALLAWAVCALVYAGWCWAWRVIQPTDLALLAGLLRRPR